MSSSSFVSVYIKVFIYSKRQFSAAGGGKKKKERESKKTFPYLRKFFVAYLSFNKIFTVIWKNFCTLIRETESERISHFQNCLRGRAKE